MSHLDSKGKCIVRWCGEGDSLSFRCTRQLDSFQYPSAAKACFLGSCPGISEIGDPRIPHKTCPQCQTVFITEYEFKIYCGSVCRKRSARKAYRERQRLLSRSFK